MAQAIQKITLNAARDIPFDKLVLSQDNVRKIKAGISIENLAEDIARRGLLTSLNVRPELDGDGGETGLYRIPAGGRRYRALERLVSQKRLSKTAGIPCIVSRGETPEVEDSLAENVQRVSLHPLDQFRAFQALRAQGLGEDEIAARFFVSVATVKQRLRLANASPRLLDLYGEDQMTLEQIIAFSITDDHARQEQVWESVSRAHSREAYYIRRLLTETAIRATDRRAVYVGVDAYEAAGGVVMRDLFDEDQGGWLQDPALLEQLCLEKLKVDAALIQSNEGWKWIETAFDFSYGHTSGLNRVYGQKIMITEEEKIQHDHLRAEYDQLDAEYAAASDYSEETEQKLEAWGAERDRLNDRRVAFDPEDIARAGVFVSLGAGGELRIDRGFVRPEDLPNAAPEVDGDGSETDSLSDEASVEGQSGQTGDEEGSKPLADRLVLDLTAARTIALRNALANDPDMAFIAVLHSFVLKTFYLHAASSCLELTLQSAQFTQTEGLSNTVWAKEIEQRQEGWGQDLPKDPANLWTFLIGLDAVSRQALFAHCASLSLNAVIEPWNRRNRALAHADALARSIGFGMVQAGWMATADNFFGRITKANILEAVRDARGDEAADRIAHMKKADMALEAERLMAGSGWLPEILRLSESGAGEGGSDTAADASADSSVVDPGDVATDVAVYPATYQEDEADHDHLVAAE